MLAWERAFKALKETGPYMTAQFTDKAINLTIELMGGWPEFCTMENDQIKWKQIEFEKIYKGVCDKGKFPDHLPGIFEQENLKKGIAGEGPAVCALKSANSSARFTASKETSNPLCATSPTCG